VASWTWSEYTELLALMAPGGTEVDGLERHARHGPPVELGDAFDIDAVPTGGKVTRCLACRRERRPGVVRLKGGLCQSCRAAAGPAPAF
jgi:hypothetical protein